MLSFVHGVSYSSRRRKLPQQSVSQNCAKTFRRLRYRELPLPCDTILRARRGGTDVVNKWRLNPFFFLTRITSVCYRAETFSMESTLQRLATSRCSIFRFVWFYSAFFFVFILFFFAHFTLSALPFCFPHLSPASVPVLFRSLGHDYVTAAGLPGDRFMYDTRPHTKSRGETRGAGGDGQLSS